MLQVGSQQPLNFLSAVGQSTASVTGVNKGCIALGHVGVFARSADAWRCVSSSSPVHLHPLPPLVNGSQQPSLVGQHSRSLLRATWRMVGFEIDLWGWLFRLFYLVVVVVLVLHVNKE